MNLESKNSGGLLVIHAVIRWQMEDEMGVYSWMYRVYRPGMVGTCVHPYPRMTSPPHTVSPYTPMTTCGHPCTLDDRNMMSSG